MCNLVPSRKIERALVALSNNTAAWLHPPMLKPAVVTAASQFSLHAPEVTGKDTPVALELL
jgi:hypothetical protein